MNQETLEVRNMDDVELKILRTRGEPWVRIPDKDLPEVKAMSADERRGYLKTLSNRRKRERRRRKANRKRNSRK